MGKWSKNCLPPIDLSIAHKKYLYKLLVLVLHVVGKHLFAAEGAAAHLAHEFLEVPQVLDVVGALAGFAGWSCPL